MSHRVMQQLQEHHQALALPLIFQASHTYAAMTAVDGHEYTSTGPSNLSSSGKPHVISIRLWPGKLSSGQGG